MNSKFIILFLVISIFTFSCTETETVKTPKTNSTKTQNNSSNMETGLKTKTSTKGFEETVDTLKSRIEAKGLRIFAVINHHQNAEKNGFELAPTTLIIFGNPNVGAPLMQMNQSIGIDLPIKMLVTEKQDVVTMTFNDPNYLKSRHQLSTDADPILAKVSGMLNTLTDI